MQYDDFSVEVMVDYKSQIFTLSDTTPPLFVHLSLTENMHHFRNIISLNGLNIKFIKIGNFSVIGVKCDLFSVADLVGKEVQCLSWCLDLAKASC